MSVGNGIVLSVLFVLILTMLHLHHSFLLATKNQFLSPFDSDQHRSANDKAGETLAQQSMLVDDPSTDSGKTFVDMERQIDALSGELVSLKQLINLKLDHVLENQGKQITQGQVISQLITAESTRHSRESVAPGPAPASSAVAEEPPSTGRINQYRPVDKSDTAQVISGCRGNPVPLGEKLVGYHNPSWEGHIPEPNKIATARTRNSIKISTYGEGEMLSSHLLESGVWEPDLMVMTQALSAHYRTTGTEMTFLDIGSNLGLFGLIAASYGHRTMFFEPVPSTISHVCESVSLNGFGPLVTAMPMGLGAARSNMFVVPILNNLGASVVRPERSYAENSENIEIEVPIATLDDIFPQLGVSPTSKLVVKVDVEGAEYYLFQGGNKTLFHPNVDVIFLENTWDLMPLRETRIQWLKDIQAQGFSLHCCSGCWPYTPEIGRCKPINIEDTESLLEDGRELVATKSPELLKLLAFSVLEDYMPIKTN